MRISILLFTLLIAGCNHHPWANDGAIKSPTFVGTEDQFDQGVRSTSIIIEGCEIALGQPYLWRDWLPSHRNLRTDRGSPLRVSVLLLVSNLSKIPHQVTWEPYIQDREGKSHSLTFFDRSQRLQQSVLLSPGAVYETELIAHKGPFLSVGRKASVHMRILVDEKYAGQLTTSPVVINQTM